MLPDHDVNALRGACHPDPFAVLGLHDVQGQPVLRVWLPGAAQVVARAVADDGWRVVLSCRHDDGLFEAPLPDTAGRDYRLQVRWRDGHDSLLADPYSVGPLIGDADLHYFSEGTHLRPFEMLGALPMRLGEGAAAIDGVRFAVWAPNARRVSVVGDFNAWDGRRHPMRSRGASGVWELFVPHAAEGDRYKFELLGADDQVLPLKADPYARAAELRPGTASIVAAMPPRRERPTERLSPDTRGQAISVYELHAGSWRRHPDGRWHSWDDLAAALPAYVAAQGFTHVELLPVSEHPFDGSWGYQTLGLYAPTARFGPPQAFARFVDACHAHGLGVILDWVPAHFPSDAHGLARFDGTALYEYADPREGLHRDWDTAIYNFGRHEVRNFLVGSALYWIERFGVDGLRVDAVASMLYRDYSRAEGEWVPNVHGGRENLEAISLLRRTAEVLGEQTPGALLIAEESTAFAGVTAPTFSGGLGFHYKWNMGWMHDTLAYLRTDPVHRRWHHDRLTFGLVYAFSERFMLALSHDEVVHGKGSLLGKMPGDEWQQFANLRAYYGFMWGHPGKKLLFMGQEWAQRSEWNHDGELPWGLLGDVRHGGVQRLVRDLNTLYRAEPALHGWDCEGRGFDWLVAHDTEASVFAWVRRADTGREVIVVSNFTPVVREGYRLGVPEGASGWREVLNTDAACYGGSNAGNAGATLTAEPQPAHGRARSVVLTLPPLATVFLVPA